MVIQGAAEARLWARRPETDEKRNQRAHFLFKSWKYNHKISNAIWIYLDL